MFVAPTRWLILQDIKNNNLSQIDLKKQFDDLGIFPDSELYLAQRLKNDSINILSIYRPSIYVNLIFEYRGNWDALNGVNFVDSIPASQRRRNLHLTPLKTCLVVNIYRHFSGSLCFI